MSDGRILFIKNELFVAEVEQKGRGVYTSVDIPEGETIEVSPVIVMAADDRQHLDKTKMHDYIFEWEPNGRKLCCVAQGYIAVYNHSYESNCEYYMDYKEDVITIKTIRAVKAGEELTINYNGDYDNEKPVWFRVKE